MSIKHKPFADLIRDRTRASVSPLGLTVVNKTGPKATIRLYDVIGWPWITAEDIASELDEITADEIEVQIASPGGSVFEGIAIYNALRTHQAKIIVRVDSMAASVASVIAQAGDHRIMLTGSQMMIHEAWAFVIGYADELRHEADVLDQQTVIIASIYAERSGNDQDGFREMMEAETWFTAEEAVEAGLADEVVTPPKDDQPEDSVRNKFAEQTESVVTDVEKLAARAEEVIAFRSEQGKPPLSEDSVEAFQRIESAAREVIDVVTSTPQKEVVTEAEQIAREHARFIHSIQE